MPDYYWFIPSRGRDLCCGQCWRPLLYQDDEDTPSRRTQIIFFYTFSVTSEYSFFQPWPLPNLAWPCYIPHTPVPLQHLCPPVYLSVSLSLCPTCPCLQLLSEMNLNNTTQHREPQVTSEHHDTHSRHSPFHFSIKYK